jgi:hypothetical protein
MKTLLWLASLVLVASCAAPLEIERHAQRRHEEEVCIGACIASKAGAPCGQACLDSLLHRLIGGG